MTRVTNCNKMVVRNAMTPTVSTVLTTTQDASFVRMGLEWQQLPVRSAKTQIAEDATKGIPFATNARQGLTLVVKCAPFNSFDLM